MQVDLKHVLIGQLYEQVALLSARVEELAKENAQLKAAAEKQQEAP